MGEVIAMTVARGDPQLENGFLKLANELVEAICKTHLSPNESQVLWFIIRMTYGYNKKKARINTINPSKNRKRPTCRVRTSDERIMSPPVRNPMSFIYQ